ncbi:MAG: ABC transporter substrate-binding protein [Firmicutes bacterium]|nr:ABC transporter substrate-binding protein [Bacillota bacterium]MDD7601934.1 ABC transporter substrate-binding protein [Bacillota bacterium]MDY5855950.1 ABC transporter substrate-binding protein [Anaerovoracaceae bacterium]
MRDKLFWIKEFLKRTWLLLLVVAIVVIAGESSVEIIKEEVLKIDPDVQYEESGTLYLACESLDTLNPILSRSEDVFHLSKLIYNSLFDYDSTMNVIPELVDSYTVNATRGLVTIKLKEGITWHDGSRLTSKDIAYTVNAIRAAGTRSLYYEKASKISYVYTRGENEADIYFRNAYDASLDDLTFPILPSAQYASAGQLAAAKENFKPVGTGQYKYQSYNYLKKLKLKPNKKYFGTRAEKKLEVEILPEKNLASNMLEIQSVTCYIDTSGNRRSTATDKDFTLYDIPSNQVEFLVFHPSHACVRDKEMRQAITTAINRENVLENGYMNDGILTDTIYYPNFCGVEDTGQAYAYDAEKAANMLKELGYEDRDNDGILEDANGKTAQLHLLVNKNNSTRLAAARLIRKDLENAGFQVTLDEMKWEEYQQAIRAGNYDILVTGFAIDEQYDLRTFFNGKREWKYYNNQLLSLASELEKLHTAEEYTQQFAKLKEALIDELPYYSLCYKKIGLVGVQGFSAGSLPMFNDYYKNIETWSWSYIITSNTEAEEESSSEKSVSSDENTEKN